MKKSEAINMAVTAVMMDRFLDLKTKQEIIDVLRSLESEEKDENV